MNNPQRSGEDGYRPGMFYKPTLRWRRTHADAWSIYAIARAGK